MATGKPGNHIQTTGDCDACHNTNAWLPASFDHSTVSGSCSTCHDGNTATGKPNGHVTTSGECDVCHTTVAWLPATFDHSSSSGICSSCHDGITATGKTSNHFITSRQCDACHTTQSWTSVSYDHVTAGYPGGHRGFTCTRCHTGNSETSVWETTAYKPDCAGCHADNWKRGPHKKTDKPNTIYYTVSELRDCAGSCHMYTDSSFTTIKKTRNREHSPNGGDF
ncbi:MAG TPA: hypothetical protein ENI97_12995 [Gammaproteobacteria bacterium]|nr:hypothetical protein [Gammaproteobacteria bacterium]